MDEFNLQKVYEATLAYINAILKANGDLMVNASESFLIEKNHIKTGKLLNSLSSQTGLSADNSNMTALSFESSTTYANYIKNKSSNKPFMQHTFEELLSKTVTELSNAIVQP